MREQIRNRIESLRAEYRTGQEMLADLEGRQAGLKVTLTRISGAIQVLEELLQGMIRTPRQPRLPRAGRQERPPRVCDGDQPAGDQLRDSGTSCPRNIQRRCGYGIGSTVFLERELPRTLARVFDS